MSGEVMSGVVMSSGCNVWGCNVRGCNVPGCNVRGCNVRGCNVWVVTSGDLMSGVVMSLNPKNLSIFSLVLKTINLRMEIQHKKVKGEIKKTLENIMIELGSSDVCQLCVQV